MPGAGGTVGAVGCDQRSVDGSVTGTGSDTIRFVSRAAAALVPLLLACLAL